MNIEQFKPLLKKAIADGAVAEYDADTVDGVSCYAGYDWWGVTVGDYRITYHEHDFMYTMILRDVNTDERFYEEHDNDIDQDVVEMLKDMPSKWIEREYPEYDEDDYDY